MSNTPLSSQEAPGMDYLKYKPAIFHIRNRTLILIASPLLMVICAIKIFENLRTEEPWLNWLAALVVWLNLLFLALRRRLVLTNDGLEYREFFRTFRTPWAQVIRIETRRALGIWHIEGLEVWSDRTKPKDLFIELTQFDKNWRQGFLGSILREKAPKLFAV